VVITQRQVVSESLNSQTSIDPTLYRRRCSLYACDDHAVCS